MIEDEWRNADADRYNDETRRRMRMHMTEKAIDRILSPLDKEEE